MIETEWVGNGDLLVSVKRKRFWLFGPENTYRYRGQCTVWHHYPAGVRCGTLTESWLSGIWKKAKWEKELS